MSHTPGPWQPRKQNAGYWVAAGEGKEAVVIADVADVPTQGGLFPASTEGNANLIAAAPELLAALQAFVEPWNQGGNWRSKITYDTFARAREAIAKAKGAKS